MLHDHNAPCTAGTTDNVFSCFMFIMITIIVGTRFYINRSYNSHEVAMQPYFIILLCLLPDNFTHQGESAAMYSIG